MISVHDALQAWQQGEITTSRAMTLTGAADILELYGLADACDVEIRLDLNEAEAALVAKVTDAIKRVMASGSDPRSGTFGARVNRCREPVRRQWGPELRRIPLISRGQCNL